MIESQSGGIYTAANQLRNFLLRFRADQSGAILIVVAMMMPILIGFVGLGVEVAWWYHDKRTMQSAADAAAIAGAYEVKRNPAITTSDLLAFVEIETRRLGYDPDSVSVTVASPPNGTPAPAGGPSGYSGRFADDASAVYVTISQNRVAMLAGLVGLDNVNITAEAVATEVAAVGEDSCIVGLKDVGTSVEFSGGANSTLTGCVPTANGDLLTRGNTTVEAKCLAAAGTYTENGNVTLDLDVDCIAPLEGQAIVTDPYAEIAAPASIAACEYTDMDAAILDPGVYCGNFTINSDKVFNQGAYILNGSSLHFNGSSSVGATGPVMFVFTERNSRTGGGNLTFNGSTVITFDAPTAAQITANAADFDGFNADDWAGILIHSDVEGGLVKINGGSNSIVYGTIHTPGSDVLMNGNSDVSSIDSCLQVIAATVKITGDQDLTTTGCDDSFKTANNGAQWAGLVE